MQKEKQLHYNGSMCSKFLLSMISKSIMMMVKRIELFEQHFCEEINKNPQPWISAFGEQVEYHSGSLCPVSTWMGVSPYSASGSHFAVTYVLAGSAEGSSAQLSAIHVGDPD